MMPENVKEKIGKLTLEGMYQNSREVNVGGLPFKMKSILVTAPLVAALNVYLVGATGEGKTQLANDLASLFGDHYCYAEGRPDFEPSEILKQLNLSKLHEVKSDRDLVELTENVRKALYYVDELNRCPPIVQNYFFNFFDGKLVHLGKIYSLGKDGYAVGFASGNIGNGAYVGTEDSDRALKDRMHLIVKLDDPENCTTENDDFAIFSGKKNPRATAPQKNKSCLDDVVQVHQEFLARDVPLILPVLGIYFHKGLDYLENTRRHSKRALDKVWPNAEGIRPDTDESLIMPFSKRAVLANIAFTQALAMIAEAEGKEVKDTAALFLDALRFTIPYSGVLSPQFVDTEKDGDALAAFEDIMGKIRIDLQEKKEPLETAIALAQYGEKDDALLEQISPAGELGKWAPVRKAIEDIAENPSDPATLADLKKKYKLTA